MLHLEINVKRRHIYALVLAIALIVTIIPVSSWAAHQFTDVPNSNIFHDDIGWMADNGITLGCNPPDNDEFCPTDNVRRETMAAFMRRLAENQVVDAKTAIDAQNADNADTVDGKDATELESLAYHVAAPSFIGFPASGSADILELDLPAGTYVIVASTTINSNSGSDMPDWSQSECSLVAGTTTQIAENIRLFANGVGDSEHVSWNIVHTFDTNGSAKITCSGGSSWSGNAWGSAITAISVQGATVQPTPTAAGSSGGGNS